MGRKATVAILLALLAGTVALYWPGLAGSFLFDDFANLPALGRYGPVQDWDGLLRYLTSGIADPTGRPISMLSFLIDANDWPAEPYPFKRTNLAIHLVNGVLLYLVLARLGRHLSIADSQRRMAALLATALWVMHPLWVSTVLYVVQRHAQLSTLFVLLGILAWLSSRSAFVAGRVTAGWARGIVAIVICGLLAGLSKANGFLLPLLLLALEATVLHPASPRPGRTSQHWRWALGALLIVPSALVVLMLAKHGLAFAENPGRRPWTLDQRLLSQPRALFDYLHQLLVPGLDATGVFADGFAVSTDWRHPRSTLPALFGLLALAATAWATRRRWPAFAAAIFFFLAGHLMESSVVPLELYFEHRNYLPALLLFWPLALAVTHPRPMRRWLMAGTLAYLALCASATLLQSRLWASPRDLSQVWAAQLPDSARAQTYAASMDISAGRTDLAIGRLEPLIARRPQEPQYVMTLLNAYCTTGQVPQAALERARSVMRDPGPGLDLLYSWLTSTVRPGGSSHCSGLPDTVLSGLAKAATEGRDHAGTSVEVRARAAYIDGLLALRQHRCPEALAAFDRRLDRQRRPEFAMEQIGLLATWCGPQDGLAHLNHFELQQPSGYASPRKPVLRLRDMIMRRQAYWDAEWHRLRSLMEEDSSPETY